jgi:hypothetical protein
VFDLPEIFTKARRRVSAASQEETAGLTTVKRRQGVESVSSLMQEPAVSLLDAATVGNPPHC